MLTFTTVFIILVIIGILGWAVWFSYKDLSISDWEAEASSLAQDGYAESEIVEILGPRPVE